jgi:thioredoxin 1
MASPNVMNVTAETWEKEVMESEIPVIVDFWHERCSWCLELNPVLEEVSIEYTERAKFVKLNVLENTENRQVAIQYGVMSTPTMKFICKGRIVGEIVGYRPKNQLREEVENILHEHQECLEKSTAL